MHQCWRPLVRAEWSGYDGASAYFVHNVRDGFNAGFDGVGAPAVGATGQSMSDGHYRYPSRSGHAGTTWHYASAIRDNWNTVARMAGVAEYNSYIKAAGNDAPIDMAGIAGPATRGSLAGAARQCMSDEHYEPAACNGRGAGFDLAGVSNNIRGVTRQIDTAWADVGSAGLYPIAGSSEQDS